MPFSQHLVPDILEVLGWRISASCPSFLAQTCYFMYSRVKVWHFTCLAARAVLSAGKSRNLATALPSLDRILGLDSFQGLSRGSGECSTSGRVGTTEQERNSEDSEAFSVP